MLKGFICPKNTETTGQEVTFDQCLGKNCKNCLPYPVRSAIVRAQSERDKWFSPSTISLCLRKAKWQLERDYYLPPMQVYASMRGSLIHEILESAGHPENTEIKLARKVDGTDIVIKGTADRIADHTLYDYKTMSDAGFNKFRKNPTIKEEHVWQTNIYKWMASEKYDIKDVKLIYAGFNNIAISGESITFDSWGREIQHNLNPCPIYSDRKIYDYLKQKVDMIRNYGTAPADSSRKWLCSVCPFTEECHKL
jgi:hypothetical protein